MTVYKHPKDYYGYSFMYKGQRYHKTFKGLSKVEVEALETVHKSELIKNGYDIAQKKVHYLEEIIKDFKEYAQAHYTRPNEFDYVIKMFLKIVGNKNVEQITLADFEKYVNYRLKKVKNSTINREMDVIRRIFSIAVDNNKLKVNPCKKLKDLRIENPPERYLTKDEEVKLLAVCNPLMKAIIITAIHTGMRENELLSLKWEDVFFDEGYLIARNTKNNKPRKLPITETLNKELRQIMHISEYVFTCPTSLTKYKDISSTFDRAVKRAKIPHISFHKLRHTTASRLNEMGVDIVTIQKILDHQDIKTTMLYTHNSSDSITNAFVKLNQYKQELEVT